MARRLMWLAWGGFACVVASVCTYFWNFHSGLSSEQATWGAFGDFIGGVTGPVLSLLALLAVLYTITLQLEELRESKREMEQSRRALQSQERSLRIQLFENSFYSQLRLLNEIVGAMDIRVGPENIKTGRDCFAHMSAHLERAYKKRRALKTEEAPVASAITVYEELYTEHQSDLAHYLRTTYNVFRFIRDQSPVEPKPYIRLARAQLSDGELLLLYYNALSDRGKNFKPLAEAFAIFDNLRPEQLLDKHHEAAYAPSAYSSDLAFTELQLQVSGQEQPDR